MKVSFRNRTGQSIWLRWKIGSMIGGGIMYEDQVEVVSGSDPVRYGWWYDSEPQPNPWTYPCEAIPGDPATEGEINPNGCHM
jgi:hypothetical protein